MGTLRARLGMSLAATAFLVACGGGSASGPVVDLPQGIVGTPPPQSSSSVVAVQSNSNLKVPSVGGFTMVIQIPQASIPVGTSAGIVASTTPFSNVPVLTFGTGMFYVQIAFSSTLNLPAFPTVTVTIPSSIQSELRQTQALPTSKFYLSEYSSGTAWPPPVLGPASAPVSKIAFVSPTTPTTFTAGTIYTLALSEVLPPTPTPSPTPPPKTPTPSPTPTPTPIGIITPPPSSPTPTPSAPPGPVVLAPTSLNFLGTAAAGVTPGVVNFSQANGGVNSVNGASCTGIVGLSVNFLTNSATVTPLAAGSCSIMFSGSGAQSTSLPVSVTVTTGSGQ